MPDAPNDTAKTSLIYFFVALGFLLFVSTMFPSCHSKQKQWIHGSVAPEGYKGPHYSPTPAPSTSHTSATPPARPSTPPTPPPPHH